MLGLLKCGELMKLSNEVNELLVELVNLESIDNLQLLEVNAGMLCQNLIEIYGKTTNSKAQDLIIKIIDKSGYSLFGPRSNNFALSENTQAENTDSAMNRVRSSSGEFVIDEDDFMNLIPINGYFH